MLAIHSSMMPSDKPVNTTSALWMKSRASGVRCDPRVIPIPTHTKLPA
jgi:hypothetical protein